MSCSTAIPTRARWRTMPTVPRSSRQSRQATVPPSVRARRWARSCSTRRCALPTAVWCALPREKRDTWPSWERCPCPSSSWSSVAPLLPSSLRGANRIASSSPCSRSISIIRAAMSKTPIPRWSPCWSVSRVSVRSSSARCACWPITTACAASSPPTSRTNSRPRSPRSRDMPSSSPTVS
ncbi:Uncharacterised protein [Collinsella intestinalis]|nr:Uncharacterised protein [Collinsella intestinalis]